MRTDGSLLTRSRASAVSGWRWEMRAPGVPLARTRVERFEVGPGEALVRVVGCGLCHTDLGFLFDGVRPRGALPLALGHEVAGEVIDAAPEHEHLVGQPVIVPAVTPCGQCAACRSGRETICAHQVMPGNDVHGGFASHLVVPARGLCVVPVEGALEGRHLGRSGCTLAELAVVADAVSTPFQALERAGVGPGDLVVVVGLGGVGGFAAQIARARGAHVVGVDVDPERLDLLARHGVELAIDPRDRPVREIKAEVKRHAQTRGAPDFGWKIVECSGTSAGQELAWSLLVPDAHLSIVGFGSEKLSVRLSNLMALDATARGNWGCVPALYPAALALALDGTIQVAPFVEVRPMAEIGAVIESARAHRLKRRAVLVP